MIPKEKQSSVFRVVKMASGQPIKAYKLFDDEIGAEMLKEDYISALAEAFGSPTFVLTKSQFLERLKKAADQVQMKMQEATVSVAGVKVK